MLDDEKRAAIVDAVLTATVARLLELEERHDLYGMEIGRAKDDGDLCIIYQGESSKGYSKFAYIYKPRAAAERIVRECEQLCSATQIEVYCKDGRDDLPVTNPENYASTVEALAKSFMPIFLMYHRESIVSGLSDSFNDTMTIAKLGFKSTATNALIDWAVVESINASEEIERRATQVADEKRERMRTGLRQFSCLTIDARAGRRPRLRKARVRAAVAALTSEGGMPPPKAVAAHLDVSIEGLRQWAVKHGYEDSEQMIRQLSELPVLDTSPNNSEGIT